MRHSDAIAKRAKRLDLAFARVFDSELVASGEDKLLVKQYLEDNYRSKLVLTRGDNIAVDQNATMAAVGAANVVSDIYRRSERGRLEKGTGS